MKNKYICIVGYGSIGKKHHDTISKIFPKLKVIVISKTLKKKNKTIVLKHLKETKEYEIFAAVICTPSTVHISNAKFFLDSRIPVFVEKPFASNYYQLLNFIEEYKYIDTLIQVGYVFRFHAQALIIKKIIKSKRLGKINYVKINNLSFLPNWRKTNYINSVSSKKFFGGGVLNEMSHEIDYLYWFFGKIKCVKSILSNYKKLKINVEDNAYLDLTTKENIKIYVHLNFSEKHINERNLLISSNKGIIYWDILKQKISIKTEKYNKSYISKKNLNKNMYNEQMKYFIKKIVSKTKTKVDFNNIKNVSEIIHYSKQSSKLGKEIKIL